MDMLNLSCPPQHDYRDPTVERDAGRLQDWLSNLPLMDVVQTVRFVHTALDAFNEQKLDEGQRFRFLEIYRTTVQRLFVTLDPLHLRQLSLSKSRRQEALQGLAGLFLSMAGGYKLIVISLYGKLQPGVPAPELFGAAIHRALEQMVFALLDSYRFYRVAEPYMTAELHQLYRLARYHGLLGRQVQEDEGGEPQLTTAMLYHAGMLLMLTDPFRLAEGEVSLLYDVLLRHAGECRIIPGSQWPGRGEGLFLIDLQGDAPPLPCMALESPPGVREPYLLDAREAMSAIRERLAATPEKVRMQSPEALLLRRLMSEEFAAGNRRDRRHVDIRNVELLPGLEGIHRYLLALAAPRPADNPDEPDVSCFGAVACSRLDQSRSGMRLAWDAAAAVDARVGELVAVLDAAGGKQSVKLAIIRSLQVRPAGGAEIGVEVMEGGPGPVSCGPAADPEQAVHALFVHADEAGGIGATLIAAKGLYAAGRQLLIEVGGTRVNARAGRLVVDTPVFDRFEFTSG